MNNQINPIGPTGGNRLPSPSKVSSNETQFELTKGVTPPATKPNQGVVAPPKPPAPVKPTPTIARRMDLTDVIDRLLDMGRSPTPNNVALITALIEYGVEASAQNASLVESMLNQKRQSNALESSVIALSKGLGESLKSVDLIAQFMSNKNQFNRLAGEFDSLIASLRLSMNLSTDAMAPGLMSGILGILSDIDDQLKRIKKLGGDMGNRLELIHDLKSASEFLLGVQRSFPHLPSAIKDSLSNVQQHLKDVVDALVGHAVMSEYDPSRPQTDAHQYYQIPNPFGTQYGPIEWLIQRDATKKDLSINPDKTKMILSFETPDLGQLTVVMEVTDKKVWMTVHSNSPVVRRDALMWVADLRNQLKAHDYDLLGVKTSALRLDIKQLLVPKVNLDRLSRIDTEV